MPEETDQLKAESKASGRDARMARVAALTTLVVLGLSGLQSRHNWPVRVSDAIYIVAGAYILGMAYRIYNRQ